MTHHVLLKGIVGSTAYGLVHEGSDIDQLGIFARDTDEVLSLKSFPETTVSTAPDKTLHEAAKYVRLALKCNPTMLELLWLDPAFYEHITELGQELINLRESFLSKKAVRDAYFGYATQQLKRVQNEDMHNVPAHTCSRSVREGQAASGRAIETLQGMQPAYGTGELLEAQASGERTKSEVSPRRSAEEARPTSDGDLRDQSVLRGSSGETPERSAPDLCGGTARSSGPQSRDGRGSRDAVPSMQPGPGALQGQPGQAASSFGLPGVVGADSPRCKRCKVEKFARHLARLLVNGFQLYQQGYACVTLPRERADYVWEFGERVAAGDTDLAVRKMAEYEGMFNDCKSVLPDEPDYDAVSEWLIEVRRTYRGEF